VSGGGGDRRMASGVGGLASGGSGGLGISANDDVFFSEPVCPCVIRPRCFSAIDGDVFRN
jgi:hypothetical protein